jgi:serine/threonine protein phosphatase PrpC
VADSATIPVLLSAALSDPGRVRTNNEDLPVLDAERGVFGVIDGVGGHAAGELAAAIARDVILQRLARPLGTPAERVREAIAIANNEIFRRAASEPTLAGMTCVVTLAVVSDGRITVGHVGDSRLYKLRRSGVRKLTHDHSPVGEREDAHEIGEIEAMHHPRRHEVFRDVGSALRDKDEPDYVEVIDDTLEDDAAILVCSDGLTDMIPSATIERVVRLHAGDAAAVTTALVAAANEAGGRDNVTVVYAESPGFATAFKAGTPAIPVSDVAPAADAAGGGTAGRSLGARLLAGRTTWFIVGAVLGVLGALLLAWRLSTEVPVGGRTIVAAPQASETVGTLAAAVQAAHAGDVIRLEPGTYAESIVVPEGVSLRARVPGSAVFVRPPGATGEWVALVAPGDGGAISGLRITSTAEAPVQVGVRVDGQGRSIELLQVDGPVTAGVDMLEDASATLQGSHFAVAGPAIVLAARSQLDATGNVFVAPAGSSLIVPALSRRAAAVAASRTAQPVAPSIFAMHLDDGARVVLNRNIFAGFGPTPIKGLTDAEREPMRTANVVVSPDPSPR